MGAYRPGKSGGDSESNPTLNNSYTYKQEGRNLMDNNAFMRVDDVANVLSVSKSYAYKLVQKLNAELKEMGYLTISGRVSKQYFLEKMCYGEQKKERK